MSHLEPWAHLTRPRLACHDYYYPRPLDCFLPWPARELAVVLQDDAPTHYDAGPSGRIMAGLLAASKTRSFIHFLPQPADCSAPSTLVADPLSPVSPCFSPSLLFLAHAPLISTRLACPLAHWSASRPETLPIAPRLWEFWLAGLAQTATAQDACRAQREARVASELSRRH